MRGAGFAPRVGLGDRIAVWGDGRGAADARARAVARASGRPLVWLEDGFLSGVAPGRGAARVSLIADDLGPYFDARRPTRLAEMIAATEDGGERAKAAMAALRAARLSKWSSQPDVVAPPTGHVLVIDQTRGDAAIAGAGATAETFAAMLAAARAEHPNAEIIVKTHPLTASGARRGHFGPEDEGGPVRLWRDPANPWDLIEGARAVYAVSSLMGAEALIAGRPLRLFATPFYGGWGAAEEEPPPPDPARRARRDMGAIFAAAWLDYPRYFDPWTGAPSDFDGALQALETLRAAARRTSQPTHVVAARLWKRGHLRGFLGPETRFDDDPARAGRMAAARGGRVALWAGKTGEVEAGEAAAHAPVARIEDGFLRSVGLGAALAPPLSICLDGAGVYFDQSRPSEMETAIETAAARPPDWSGRARARALADRIAALAVTKYNLTGGAPPIPPPGAQVLLVPGQVEDDASIRLGATGGVRTNADLIRAARAARPGAWLVYKPHPDVEAGLRPGAVDPETLSLADAVAREAPAAAMLAMADEVATITSLMGFEALLRGKPVICFGAPFYAGWGLTEDRAPTPERRRARPDLAALIHAALIDYPLYRDPVSGLACPPEVIVERLAAGEGRTGPGNRLLSKAQGALASYAWLWR